MPTSGLDAATVERIRTARHADPFGVLGPHADAHGHRVATFQPGAAAVRLVDAGDGSVVATLRRLHEDGVFEATGLAAVPASYRFLVDWAAGGQSIVDDPYRYPPVLGATDAWLLAEGTHLRPCEVLGAHPCLMLGGPGTRFAVWAPNATRVSVVGDFNHWDGRRHPMRLRAECGVWEIFLPGVAEGARYKYEVLGPQGELLPLKADPYALRGELRPSTASIVARLPPPVAPSSQRRAANALDAPISIYEVHPGSWRRHEGDGLPFLDWDELAAQLLPYVVDLGFTHLELMPVSEYPFDGSWGYQPVGLYAPSARFASHAAGGTTSLAGFRRFVAQAHELGIGILLDWVPAHFPDDPHGLAMFDGTHLYDHADPREGFHIDWNSLIYNYGRTEVRNFLVGNALYWLERHGVDGLRVDAVASMLYRDYSRKPGEWVPNVHGGRENLEAISLLQRMNEVIGVEREQAVTIAEESTAFPGVSRPPYAGGLGFHYKWNMGWMHDTLAYMAREPVHRKYHHNELGFGLVYAFDENFVLPISHDEVVHGKGSLISKMPGDEWQRFANLRAYFGFMWGHPGKKLLFMGCEFAQEQEWNHDRPLDWALLGRPLHAGTQRLVRDLNALLRACPALHEQDFTPAGFAWIDHTDAERSLLSFTRRARTVSPGNGSLVAVVCNFTPVVHEGQRVGVPEPGTWRERLNTDSQHYGGSNLGTPFSSARSEPVPWQGQPHSIVVTLPPLATTYYTWEG